MLDRISVGFAVILARGFAMAKDKRGLPDKLKAGIEQLSGMNLDDVRVHLNSPLPAQHQVLA